VDFDPDEVFDEDYLHFYAARLGDAASDADAERIVALGPLAAGDRVLDLACGHGRIAVRLAARGARVTALDRSAAFLRLARAEAARRGVDVTWLQGDMRELAACGEQDLVVCWFTSFGYFDEAGDRRVLEGVHGALRQGGRLLLELNHGPALLAEMRPVVVERMGDDRMTTAYRYDARTRRMLAHRTVERAGRARTFHYATRLFALPELRELLADTGFSRIEGFGPEGARLRAEDRRMIVRAER
jgi:SAM-dependent methyltransferase